MFLSICQLGSPTSPQSCDSGDGSFDDDDNNNNHNNDNNDDDKDDNDELVDGVAILYVKSCRLYIQADVRRIRSTWQGVLSVTKGGRVLIDMSVLADVPQSASVPDELRSWLFNPFSRGLDDLVKKK